MSEKIAAAYIRVSTDDQLEYSPDSQLRVILDYARRNGFTVPEKYVFIDEGISGRRAEKRPAFMKMISVAKSTPKPFAAILLWKFSRFARNRQDSIVYKSMLRRQLGIEVLSVSEAVGDDKLSILIEALIEAMDEYYSVNLGEEVRRGMTEKARRGEPLSAPPFGYRLTNKRLEIIPDEAEIIVTVFRRYAAGDSPSEIARALNAAGVRSHRGGKIEGRTVEYWLNNPIYNGKIRWTPTEKLGRNFNNPAALVTEGEHEPIISPELWRAASERAALSLTRSARTGEPSHWLVGLVRCGLCGSAMVNCRGYLYCGGKSRSICVGNKGLRLDLLCARVTDAIESFSQYLPQYTVEPASPGQSASASLLTAARNRLRRAYEAYEAGVDTIEEYRSNKAKITSEIESIEAELLSPLSSTVRSGLADLFSDSALKNSVKSAVARSFIREITVLNNEITITFFI